MSRRILTHKKKVWSTTPFSQWIMVSLCASLPVKIQYFSGVECRWSGLVLPLVHFVGNKLAEFYFYVFLFSISNYHTWLDP